MESLNWTTERKHDNHAKHAAIDNAAIWDNQIIGGVVTHTNGYIFQEDFILLIDGIM